MAAGGKGRNTSLAAAEAVRFHRAHQDAWLESVFFRVHTRCAVSVSRAFGARSRRVFEVACALVAAGGLGMLVGLHQRYTGSTELSRALRAAKIDEARAYAVRVAVGGDDEDACGGGDYVYWYSPERGIVELSEAAMRDLAVPVRCVAMTRRQLGPWPWRVAAGTDAIVANAALRAFGCVGRVRLDRSRDGYDLSRCDDKARRFNAVFKIAVAIKTIFLVFATSTLASYTLRETQARMLRFAYLIKERVSNRQSYVKLVTLHLLDSVVFAPITLGMLSFLYEFFADQLLALLILTLIWGCELFGAVSLRSLEALHSLPHLIVLYLAALHIYVFLFPLGFFYVAFGTTLAAIGHVMFYFWNHFELPALLSGLVSVSRPRAAY
ncbi:hypothetical protein CTAYLR_005935 [Chrysophaeum taylorii]|uniref:Uncharacterized protein n=1 Tax=Chrysophaeum taylorii TaxID=2483200 RepID=A0AAD7UBW4_9STRA|nr:hypothetical protein CTAYLR_005935 [Chrysophaeum taylorii]